MNNSIGQDESSSIETEENKTIEILEIEALKEKIIKLETDLSTMESKAADNWDLVLRAKAEEENFKKRSRIDLENAHKYSIEKFARSMISVVDTLERGIESSLVQNPTDTNGKNSVNESFPILKSLRNGMELTLKLLLDNLEQFGVKMINPEIGSGFNPIEHEALAVQDNLDLAPNSIMQVIQKGFIIWDRVLRPARVIVTKRP